MAEITDRIRIGNVEFKNRVVMAPMMPFGWWRDGGDMDERTKAHYLDRADAGIGLMIVHALTVSPKRVTFGRAGMYEKRHEGAVRSIADACHGGASGTRLFVQLTHAGFEPGDGERIEDLSAEEFRQMGREYADAARLCREAGADGVELHMAHGTFLNIAAEKEGNARTDRYGGDLHGRLTLMGEIMDDMNGVASDDFIVTVRMGWQDDETADAECAAALEEMGVRAINVSSGTPSARRVVVPEDFPYSDTVYAAKLIKRSAGVPVMAVGGIDTFARANDIIENGYADFAVFGKPFLADARFAEHSAKDPSYSSCIKCRDCSWFSDGEKCPVRRRLMQK